MELNKLYPTFDNITYQAVLGYTYSNNEWKRFKRRLSDYDSPSNIETAMLNSLSSIGFSIWFGKIKSVDEKLVDQFYKTLSSYKLDDEKGELFVQGHVYRIAESPQLGEIDNKTYQSIKTIILLVTTHFSALKHLDNNLKKDKENVLTRVNQNGLALQYADESLRKDKEVVLAAVKQNGLALEYADESLKKDKEIVLGAVKQHGASIEYADKSFFKDKEIVFAAVNSFGYVIKYVDDTLKKDKEIVLAAVKECGYVFSEIDESFMKDRDVVLAAVKKSGDNLQYVDESFRKDKEVVLAAVMKDGIALTFADDFLKGDKDIALVAIKQSSCAFAYVDMNLRKDKDFVFKVVSQYSFLLKDVEPCFKKDKEIVLAAIKTSGTALQYADESLKKDEDIVTAAVERTGSALEFCDDSFKKDKQIVLNAIKQSVEMLRFADDCLKNDAQFMGTVSEIHFSKMSKKNNNLSTFDKVLEKIAGIKVNKETTYRKIALYNWFIKALNTLNKSLVDLNGIPESTWDTVIDLSDPEMRYELIEMFATMTKDEFKNYHQLTKNLKQPNSYLTALYMCRIFSKPEDCKEIWKKCDSRAFRDGERIRLLLKTLKSLRDGNIYEKDHILNILEIALLCNDSELINLRLKSIPSILALGGADKMIESGKELNLTSLLKDCFRAKIPIPEQQIKEMDFDTQLLSTFLKMRSPEMLYVYAGRLEQHTPEALETLGNFVTLVLNGKFKSERYENSSHLDKVFSDRKELKEEWIKGAEKELVLDNNENTIEKEFNYLEYVKDKVVHKHIDVKNYPFIERFINSKKQERLEIIKSLNETINQSDEKNLFLLSLQQGLINLMQGVEKSKQKDLLESISLSFKTIDPDAEFNNDLKALLMSFEIKKEIATYTIKDTDDYWDIFLCGTERLGKNLSCL